MIALHAALAALLMLASAHGATADLREEYAAANNMTLPANITEASLPPQCMAKIYMQDTDCGAFTFAGPESCLEEENGPGCCWLKYSSGYEITDAPNSGLVSGILPTKRARPNANCLIVPQADTDPDEQLSLDEMMPDLVVPAFSAKDCCNACAMIPECGSFVLKESTECDMRLGWGNPGCCYLKPGSAARIFNHTVSEEDNIVGTRYMVAGKLLGTAGMPSADTAGAGTDTGTVPSGTSTPSRKMK